MAFFLCLTSWICDRASGDLTSARKACLGPPKAFERLNLQGLELIVNDFVILKNVCPGLLDRSHITLHASAQFARVADNVTNVIKNWHPDSAS